MTSEREDVTYTESQLKAEREHVSLLLKEHEYILSKAKALKRLINNPDFKEVFIDYYQDVYLKHRVDDLVLTTSPQVRQSANDKVLAVGSFKQFCKELLLNVHQKEAEAEECRKHLDYLDTVIIVEDNE